MIRDFSTGLTKFVKYTVIAPDGRFGTNTFKGGITLALAKFEAKKYDKMIIIDIFDSYESINDQE